MDKVFRAWDPDASGEEEAEDVLAFNAERAAEMYVEKHHADMDYCTVTDICVIDPNGVRTDWEVRVETMPVFYAHQKKATATS